jgi:hypothetical protein
MITTAPCHTSMIDYSICARREASLDALASISKEWDLFISAYNTSDRVQQVYGAVSARRKLWLVQPEYGFAAAAVPEGAFVSGTRSEAEFWHEFDAFAGADWSNGIVCVDITGFMRPQLVFLVVWLLGAKKKPFIALYTDPTHYAKQENTVFSKGPVIEVRQIAGCEGAHVPETGADCLFIGMGYDDELVRRVAESKEDARKIQMYGLPSLAADMYQESVLRSFKASEALGPWWTERCFAPANDPFATANVLQERVQQEHAANGLTNLYLSPLGTKPQVLGFALYFATERRGTPSSIIFPFTGGYEQETSKGVARSWVYDVEHLAP